EIRSGLQKPLQSAIELGNLGEQLRLESLHRKQWDEPDHGADPQRLHSPVGQMQYVVEELVLLIPQAHTVPILAADMAHGFRDVQEVLEELGRDVLIHP